MAFRTLGAVCALALLTLTVPLLAHHSSAGNFDLSKSVTIEGFITKVTLANPHSVMYLDAKNAKGIPETWILYGKPPSALTRQGFSNATFKEGLHVTAVGNPALDTSAIAGQLIDATANGKTAHVIEVGEVRLADGQVVAFGRGPVFTGRIAGQQVK